MMRGTANCPICGSDIPHHHDDHEVERERFCRPAFEKWAVAHIFPKNNLRPVGGILVDHPLDDWMRRGSFGHPDLYDAPEVNLAWLAFAEAWFKSDASIRKVGSKSQDDPYDKFPYVGAINGG